MILAFIPGKTIVETGRRVPGGSPYCGVNIEVEDSLRAKYACGGINYHQ